MAGPDIVAQARMGSTRLSDKVLEDLADAPAMKRLFGCQRRVKSPLRHVLATNSLEDDDVLTLKSASRKYLRLTVGG